MYLEMQKEMFDAEEEQSTYHLLQWLHAKIDEEVELHAGTGDYRVYFYHIFNEDPTKFEEQSLKLKIAFVAPTEELGVALCRLLKCVIDGDIGAIEYCVWEAKNNFYADFRARMEGTKKPIPHSLIYKEMCEVGRCLNGQELAGPFVGEYIDENDQTVQVTKDWSSVDIWTWKRLSPAFEKFTDNYC